VCLILFVFRPPYHASFSRPFANFRPTGTNNYNSGDDGGVLKPQADNKTTTPDH
jgi:hypothetical protein